MVYDGIEYDQWLSEQKLSSTFRFENRQLQMIGILSILLAVSSPEDLANLNAGLTGMLFALILILVLIYLFFAIPRARKYKLKPMKDTPPTAETFNGYIKEIEGSMKFKVKLMYVSYAIFIIAMGTAIFSILYY